MRDIVNVMLAVNAGAYSFEAGNMRHEHEWRVWQDVKLPDGKIILPGVVSHATNVVEHPELVAERITRFANLVGREPSSPPRIAGSADACIATSRGRSSGRSRRAPRRRRGARSFWPLG
jgi:5-methyltetrahydropteroyltriglutamate--homocysteine methyltransferase